MSKPEALAYRGNTGNAGYGFEQAVAPDGKMFLKNRDFNESRVRQDNQAYSIKGDLRGVNLNYSRADDDSDDDVNEPNQYKFHVAGNLKQARKQNNNTITGF